MLKPFAAVHWNFTTAAHLLNRVGFGGTPAEIEKLAAMSPQGRIAEPGEIAHAVAWLLSTKSSFVTGDALPIDGGWAAQ